jgi:recombination protein RecA
MYNEGISTVGDIIDLGVETDIIAKRGAFYRYNEAMLGQGREASKEALRNDPALAREIENLIRQKTGLPQRPMLPTSNGEVPSEAVAIN